MHIYPWQIDPAPPLPIEHRSLENQYTKEVSYIAQCTYTHGRLTPTPQLGTDALNTTTPNWADLLTDLPQSIKHRCLEYHYTKCGISTGKSTPQSIEHRSLEYHYTKLGQIYPQSIKQRCLAYCYTKLDRSTPPPVNQA